MITGDFLLPPEEEVVVATMAPLTPEVLPEDEAVTVVTTEPMDPRAFYVGLRALAEPEEELLRPEPVAPGLSTPAPTRVVSLPAPK